MPRLPCRQSNITDNTRITRGAIVRVGLSRSRDPGADIEHQGRERGFALVCGQLAGEVIDMRPHLGVDAMAQITAGIRDLQDGDAQIG